MNNQAAGHLNHKDNDYERITRRIRWYTIGIAAVTLPPGLPQSDLLYGLIAVASVYNLSRYLPFLAKIRVYMSPVTMLVTDNLFVALFLYLIGTTSTPYSAFLVFMVISAAYRYGLRGLIAVVAGQAVLLATIVHQSPFMPLDLDPLRLTVLSVMAILTVGLYAEQLTRMDRNERHELKALGRQSQAERERLLTLINTLNDAIFVTDAKGRIMLANGAARELAAKQEGIEGRELTKLLPLRPRTKPNGQTVDILQADSAPQHRRDLLLTHADGTTADLDISVTPVKMGGEKNSDYIIVCRDITKERSLDLQREEFISVASHELRTPLAIVEAALSTALLIKESQTPQLKMLIEQAHRNVEFLSGLIQDLSTLSQAQNDNIPIALKPVAPKELLHQLAIDFEAQAKQKNLPMQVVIAPETPSVLSTEHHIREILQNYLNNALKYTDKGRVVLNAEPSQNGGVLFSVSDTGVGISVADQQNLFTKFYRAEDYRTRETGGTGLGLYLCLELAQRLNAKVWCKSALNEGSTFYLDVPPFSRLERDHGKVVEAQVSSLVDQL